MPTLNTRQMLMSGINNSIYEKNFILFYKIIIVKFPGLKRPGREADHSPPASAEVKKMWIYTSTPPYAFMA
jgi:hypothetical protein